MASKFSIERAPETFRGTGNVAVRADIDVRTGEGAVGRALGQAVIDIGTGLLRKSQRELELRQRLEAKNRKNLDDNNAAVATGLRNTATELYEVFKETAQSEELEPFRIKQAQDLSEQIAGLNFSPEEQEKQRIKSLNYASVESTRAFGDATSKLKAQTITIQTNALIEAFTSGSPEEIAEQARRYAESMKNNGFNVGIIPSLIKTAQEIGEKKRNKNAFAAKRSEAGIFPETVFAQMNAEIEARAKGEGSPELADLTGVDLISIREFAESAGAKKITDSEIATSVAEENSFSKIRDGDIDIDKMIDAIENNPIITSKDSNRAAKSILSFSSLWNSAKAIKAKKVVTDNSTRIKALSIINEVKRGDISLDSGLFQYTKLEKTEPIESIENKGFINDIFKANEEAKDIVKRRRADILSGREKRLRDAVELQPSLIPDDEGRAEIMKDFANIAVITLNDRFRDGDFTKDDVDEEIDRLITKYTLSDEQQLLAVEARNFRLAKTLTAQQASITKIVDMLKQQGKDEEAKKVLDEAKDLGIFEIEDGQVKRTKGKKKGPLAALRDIIINR